MQTARPPSGLAAAGIGDAIGDDDEAFHMAFSQERDSLMAQLMMPTME